MTKKFSLRTEKFISRFDPLSTSNYFKKGHSIRIEISSSNFPRFGRNINTGGNNYYETEGVIAENKVYHSNKYPLQIRLPITNPKN
ncbi:MAG: CocE/NonD family hydrolase C-terminal non-catalytic domain-containing protein [Gelidibacter sp.]